jgi:hypothetical protein
MEILATDCVRAEPHLGPRGGPPQLEAAQACRHLHHQGDRFAQGQMSEGECCVL